MGAQLWVVYRRGGGEVEAGRREQKIISSKHEAKKERADFCKLVTVGRGFLSSFFADSSPSMRSRKAEAEEERSESGVCETLTGFFPPLSPRLVALISASGVWEVSRADHGSL